MTKSPNILNWEAAFKKAPNINEIFSKIIELNQTLENNWTSPGVVFGNIGLENAWITERVDKQHTNKKQVKWFKLKLENFVDKFAVQT